MSILASGFTFICGRLCELVLLALLDLRFNAFDNFVDASPCILILSSAPYDKE